MTQRRIDTDIPARGAGDNGGIDSGVVVPIIIDRSLLVAEAREDAVDGGGALGEDGGDEDCGAEEELTCSVGEGGVVGEFPAERAHDGGACGVSGVE